MMKSSVAFNFVKNLSSLDSLDFDYIKELMYCRISWYEKYIKGDLDLWVETLYELDDESLKTLLNHLTVLQLTYLIILCSRELWIRVKKLNPEKYKKAELRKKEITPSRLCVVLNAHSEIETLYLTLKNDGKIRENVIFSEKIDQIVSKRFSDTDDNSIFVDDIFRVLSDANLSCFFYQLLEKESDLVFLTLAKYPSFYVIRKMLSSLKYENKEKLLDALLLLQNEELPNIDLKARWKDELQNIDAMGLIYLPSFVKEYLGF